MTPNEEKKDRIRRLNDEFRKTGAGGRVVITQGIQALPSPEQRELISRIRQLNEFDAENDPYGEHDFAAITIGDNRAYFKIDYYNSDLTSGSEDPSDPEVTTRVMTIMLAHEY